MPQDRSLLALLREALTEKKVRRFFPNPADPTDAEGNTTRLSEYIDSALWWLGTNQTIELIDSSTYIIPTEGRLDLGPERTSKIRKLRSIEQNEEFYEEARVDWSEGLPLLRGSWIVHRHHLYVLGLYTKALPILRRSRNGCGPEIFIERQLFPGAVTLYYDGIPQEADIIDVPHYRQAVIDYACHLALRFILTHAVRDKVIKMPGIPEIRVNVKDLQSQSQAHLDAAKMVLDHTYATSA